MIKINISKTKIDEFVQYLKNVSVPSTIGANLVVIANVLEKAEEVVEKKEETKKK